LGFDPLYAFVFAGLFSPGPNVILLTASGARFGFRATIPHVAGVVIGVGIIAGLTGFGLGALLLAMPSLTLALKIAAALWILWLAWSLLRATRTGRAAGPARPFTLIQAVLFQWVNPKVWAVALVASAGYNAGLSPVGEALRLATAFSGLNLFVCLFWSFAGHLLARLFNDEALWRAFMFVMAFLLALSALLVFV
jgi:threonine/homoserine/homoserine lactone efflux protein